MPAALLKKINRLTKCPMDKMEKLWDKAKELADRYKDGPEYYAVTMKIFKNMMNVHCHKEWLKYKSTSASKTESATVTLTLKGDCVPRFLAMLKLADQTTNEGSGFTIKYETNSGEKGEIYLDGDGIDRLEVA